MKVLMFAMILMAMTVGMTLPTDVCDGGADYTMPTPVCDGGAD